MSNNKDDDADKINGADCKESLSDETEEAKIKLARSNKTEGSGLTKEFGKPIAATNEVSQMHADVSSQYDLMHRNRNIMAQSGISQVFGDLLPKKAGAKNEASKDKEAKAMSEPKLSNKSKEGEISPEKEAGAAADNRVLAEKNQEIVSKYRAMRRTEFAQSGITQAFGDLLPKKSKDLDNALEEEKDSKKD